MLEILQYIISVLTSDATLNAIVPAANIFTGGVDVVTQKQSELLLPQINVHGASESSRSIPSYTRDTMIQLDIWSRNDMLEVLNIYERIETLFTYKSPTQSTAKLFWTKLSGAVDQYESDRRIWHRAVTITVWSQKITS